MPELQINCPRCESAKTYATPETIYERFCGEEDCETTWDIRAVQPKLEPLHQLLGREVYTALRRNAPAGWVTDYVEVFGEYPNDRQTFEDYLRWQLGMETTELTGNPPEYKEAIRQYLAEHYPAQAPLPQPVHVDLSERQRRVLWEAISMIDLDTLNDNLAKVHLEETGEHERTQLMEELDPDEKYEKEWEAL